MAENIYTEETKEQFEITNDSTAEWALKKVLSAERERDRLLELIETEEQNLELQRQETERRYESDTAFLLAKLSEYFDKVERKATKTQETYQLLSGKLVRKYPKLRLVPNEEALLKFCKANIPEYVKLTEKPMWGEIKERFGIVDGAVVYTDTGEIVDCVCAEEVPAAFGVVGK